MKKIAILLIVLVVVGVAFLSGCFDTASNVINPPKVEIMSKSTRTGYEGLDYVVYVDVTVYNRGGDGKTIVWAKVAQDSNEWSKQQSIYITGEEIRDLTFTFREFSFWSLDSGSYWVWVE